MPPPTTLPPPLATLPPPPGQPAPGFQFQYPGEDRTINFGAGGRGGGQQHNQAVQKQYTKSNPALLRQYSQALGILGTAPGAGRENNV
jgi:hypothetical protein